MKHSPSFLILRQTLLRQTYLRIQCMIDFNEIAYQLVISVLQCFACAVYFASQCYIIFINLKLKEECNKTFCLFLCLFFCSQLCYAIFHLLKKDWKRIATLFCLLLFPFRFFSLCFVVLLPLHLVYFDYQQALKILKLTEISAIHAGSAWNCSQGITFTVFIRLSSNLTGW